MEIVGVRNGSAAEDAGLRQGDVLLSVGGREVTVANWQEALGAFKTGERVPVKPVLGGDFFPFEGDIRVVPLADPQASYVSGATVPV